MAPLTNTHTRRRKSPSEARAAVTCHVGDCDKPTIPRMKVCWAHYQRTRRESKKTAPVRNYGTGQKDVSTPALAAQVIDMLRRAAKNNEDAEGEPLTQWEVSRRVVKEWLARYDAGAPTPFLCGPKSLDTPVFSESGYAQASKITLLPEEVAILGKAVKEAESNIHALLVMVFDDWFYYWMDHRTQPRGAVGGSTSPWPKSK